MVALKMTDPHETRLERAMHGKRVNMFAAGAVCALIGVDDKARSGGDREYLRGQRRRTHRRERYPRGRARPPYRA